MINKKIFRDLTMVYLPPDIIYLIFEHIQDPNIFGLLSRVCKEWRYVLDNHNFWKQRVNTLGLPEPSRNATKYKTYKSIFIKNIELLCYCKNELDNNIKSIKLIHQRLELIKEYCNDRYFY